MAICEKNGRGVGCEKKHQEKKKSTFPNNTQTPQFNSWPLKNERLEDDPFLFGKVTFQLLNFPGVISARVFFVLETSKNVMFRLINAMLQIGYK